MKVLLKSVKFIFVKIPAMIIFAIITCAAFLLRHMTYVVALLFRIIGALVLLITALTIILGVTEFNKMIWPAIGGTSLLLLPFLCKGFLLFMEFIKEGLKTVILYK